LYVKRNLFVVVRGAADKSMIVAHMVERGFVLQSPEDQSRGQEEDLIFARSSSPDQLAAPHEAWDEHIAGLYDLKSHATVAGSVRLSDDRMEITTAPAQWAYTAVIPVNRESAPEGSTVRLTLAMEVDSGTLQVGILNQAETDFITTATLEAGSPRTVELVIPRFDRVGALVVRNASADGFSHGWVRLLETTAEMLTEAAAGAAPSSEEALFLADQIRASAQGLASMVANNAGSPTLIAEIGEAAELLRPLLGRGNLALIRAQPAAIEAVFAGLDVQILRALADHLKILLPLRPMPGWRFDEFLSRPDLATLVRYALWNTLRRLPDRPALALPWHGGTSFATHFDNDLSLAVYVGGAFEPNEFAFLDSLVEPGMNVLDGGANEGAYTLFLARKVGPAGHVIAVEPSSRELERLHANVAANNLNNVAVVALALADRAGEVLLKIAETDHAGQNTIGKFVNEGVISTGTEVVPTATLDELVATHGLAGLDVIKLDVEGAELRVLMGAENILRTARPLVLLEASPAALARQGRSVKDMVALLDRTDYRMLRFDHVTGQPVPLGEGLLSENLLAVHRNRDWGLPME
jgi:FkbM family methyltransferase